MADDFFSRHFPPKPPILKIGKEINRGAYGTVYEGEMNENPVAVKKIHRVLLETSLQQGATTILDSFKNECALLEKADNVHVVRFHGAYYDEESQEPILVMEKLHQNLSEYLTLVPSAVAFKQQNLQIFLSRAVNARGAKVSIDIDT